MINILGIDPGRNGYIVCIEFTKPNNKPFLRHYEKLPELDGTNIDLLNSIIYYEFKCGLKINLAFIERPGQYTRNLTVLTRQHREYAEIRAALLLNNIETIDVEPKKWKDNFRLTKDKRQSIKLAQLLIDGIHNLRAKDHDLCEACLIGLYGYQMYKFSRNIELTT